MGDSILRDGTGTGTRAQVDSANRLAVVSTSSAQITYVSAHDALAFVLGINEFAVGTGDSNILYFQNTDPTRVFHIWRIFASWNGGSTTGTKILTGRFHFAAPGLPLTAPTANNLALAPSNLNLGNANTALATSYIWNGTSTGMTVASNGAVGFSSYLTAGYKEIDLDGTFIFSYGQAILISVLGGEVGLASVQMSGWYDTAQTGA